MTKAQRKLLKDMKNGHKLVYFPEYTEYYKLFKDHKSVTINSLTVEALVELGKIVEDDTITDKIYRQYKLK